MSDGQQIQSDGEDVAVQAELSMLRPDQPAVPSDNGASRVPKGKPPLLEGVPVQTNNPTVRRMTYEAYWRDELESYRTGLHLLTVKMLPLVIGLVDNVDRRRKLAKARDTLERRLKSKYSKEEQALVVLTAELKGREIEKDIAQKDAIILKQMSELGWTPISMARLGLDVAKGQAMDLASAMAERTS